MVLKLYPSLISIEKKVALKSVHTFSGTSVLVKWEKWTHFGRPAALDSVNDSIYYVYDFFYSFIAEHSHILPNHPRSNSIRIRSEPF
jgi:hypothetical protein